MRMGRLPVTTCSGRSGPVTRAVLSKSKDWRCATRRRLRRSVRTDRKPASRLPSACEPRTETRPIVRKTREKARAEARPKLLSAPAEARARPETARTDIPPAIRTALPSERPAARSLGLRISPKLLSDSMVSAATIQHAAPTTTAVSSHCMVRECPWRTPVRQYFRCRFGDRTGSIRVIRPSPRSPRLGAPRRPPASCLGRDPWRSP